MNSEQRNQLLLFTSLPKVGGHSAITLGLCRMLRSHFKQIDVWCKTMPEHGHSDGAQQELEQGGCRVERISDDCGRIRFGRLAGLAVARTFDPPDAFLALAMRHLSPPLAVATRARRSIYYHITHDLNAGTIRRLEMCGRTFSRLVFICPATAAEFQRLGGRVRPDRIAWVPQPSELPVTNPELLEQERQAAAQGAPLRFGLIGRLTREKGAEAMLRFADQCHTRCELHVAGAGPFAEAFAGRAQRADSNVRVVFHGAYDPAQRRDFLRKFFCGIDCLVVPSLDDWETLSMAALEALQHGVPAILCRTGGLVSFALPELGPAPERVVRLVAPADLPGVLAECAATRAAAAGNVNACRAYYAAHFSDTAIGQRWLGLFGIATPVSTPGFL